MTPKTANPRGLSATVPDDLLETARRNEEEEIMFEDIRAYARKVAHYTTFDEYKGFIAVYENGSKLYTKTAGPGRITRQDALEDAQHLKDDYQHAGKFMAWVTGTEREGN